MEKMTERDFQEYVLFMVNYIPKVAAAFDELSLRAMEMKEASDKFISDTGSTVNPDFTEMINLMASMEEFFQGAPRDVPTPESIATYRAAATEMAKDAN